MKDLLNIVVMFFFFIKYKFLFLATLFLKLFWKQNMLMNQGILHLDTLF